MLVCIGMILLIRMVSSACHYSCTLCSVDNSQYHCSNCGTNSVTHRSLSLASSCDCDAGYQDLGAVQCSLIVCDYSCSTCVTDATTCSACNTTAHRQLVSTSCLCKVNYYDDNTDTQECQPCDYTCHECSGAAATCTSCDNADHRTFDGSTSCPCDARYFDSGSSLCSECSNQCAECDTVATNCTSCRGSNRNSAPGCSCPNRLYDDTLSADCQPCQYTCLTCSDSISCDSCDGAKNRLSSSDSSFCVCASLYYDDGENQTCADCYDFCLTCDGPLQTDCITCDHALHRELEAATGKCICSDGYYVLDSITVNCLTCDSTCLTCYAQAICSSCDAAAYRESGPSNSCVCMDGYYEDSNKICKPCLSSCETCTNATSCATCPPSENKVIGSSGICECANTTFWNSTTSTCQSCSYKCATCSIQPTNCTSCSGGDRSYVPNSCDCDLYFYDDGSSANCVACPYHCHQCDANGCTSCSSAKHRTLSGTACACQNGYYDDNTNDQLCKVCDSSCLTCTNGSQCATCDIGLHYILNSTNLCSCAEYYFQNGTGCSACHYTCATCANTTDECVTCDAAMKREKNITDGKCQCMDKFFDDGNAQLCESCLYDCLTCVDASECLSCDAALFRVINSDNRCECQGRYFQNNSDLCQECHYSCLTCSGPASTDCLTCNNTASRYHESGTGECLCQSTHYDDSTNQQCQICDRTCQTCSDGVSCDACDSGTGRSLGPLCSCPSQHFFDDGSTIQCYDCHYSCLTCTNDSVCVSCDVAMYRQHDQNQVLCECMDRYYDDGLDNQQCRACNYACRTCTNSTVCQSCNTTAMRSTPSSGCPCNQRFFDNGVEQCVSCQYTCSTCTNLTQCATCDPLKNRSLDINTDLCICDERYYDDGSLEDCQPCLYSCVTCLDGLTCETCDSGKHREHNGSNCVCEQYYFDDLVNQQCLACERTCHTCSSTVTCDSCDSAMFRQADTNTDLCKCQIGYFDDGSNRECVVCEDSCLECVDSTECTNCDAALYRELNTTVNYLGISDPYCTCMYRYYSPSQDAACQPCHYSCQVCTGPGEDECAVCNQTANRALSSDNQCLCEDGYYEDGVQNCPTCHGYCILCTGPTVAECTECQADIYLLDTTCYTECPLFYFSVDASMTCQACSQHCEVCDNQTYCTECEDGFPLYQDECYDECPEVTYLNSGENACYDCPTGCSNCTSDIKCGGCNEDYYFDQSLELCFDCHEYCKGCFGPGMDQCEDCQYPLFFRKHQCFNITCPYTQYIDSYEGCKQCSQLFPNSLTCNISEAFICLKGYLIDNGRCVECSDVNGYYLSSSGVCAEICGDGLLMEYQCDDGNKKDGDGCASNCLIEEGWVCDDSVEPSVCELDFTLSLTVSSFFKYGGQNKVKISFSLNIPIDLTSTFSLQIGDVDSSLYSWTFQQSEDFSEIHIFLSYSTSLDKKSLTLSYADGNRRLLLSSSNVTIDKTFTLSPYPPAIYHDEKILEFYASLKQVIFILMIVLLGLCLLLIPSKVHLHSVTLIWIPAYLYLVYGVAMENSTDWVKWSLENLGGFALVGGFSIGQSSVKSEFLAYSSSLFENTGFMICASVGLWIFYGVLSLIHHKCCQFPKAILYIQYFVFTLQLAMFFPLSFGSLNALANSSLGSLISALNVSLAIFVHIYILAELLTVWVLSYLLPKKHAPQKSPEDFRHTRTTSFSHSQKINQESSASDEFEGQIKQPFEAPFKESSSRQIIKAFKEGRDSEEKQSLSAKSKEGNHQDKDAENKDIQWLVLDYSNLYKPRQTARYFLPCLLTKLWLTTIVAVFLQANPSILFIVLAIFSFVFSILLLIFTPFYSTFTNIRLIVLQLLFLAANSLSIYYAFEASSDFYESSLEQALIILFIAIISFAIFSMFLQQILAWKKEIWEKLQPCFTKGKKRRRIYPSFGNRLQKMEVEEINNEEQKQEGLDAFYARMIKKQNLQRQYRRERMMKQPKRARY